MSVPWLGKAATSLALILFVTAATRVAFAVYQLERLSSPGLERAAFDTEAGSIGRSLASGKGYSSPYNRETGPTAILPPVYPLLVTVAFRLFGIQSRASFLLLLLMNLLFAVLTCIPVFHLGRMAGGLPLAAVAGWLWALFPNGILIPFEWIWDTSLSALVAATLLWRTAGLAARPSRHEWLIYGLLWGFALMSNPVFGAALPALLLWAAWRGKKADPRSWRNAALASVLIVACCLPWTVRNYRAFQRFIPLRSGFGFELYIGNNENYAEPRVWPPRVSYERELVRYIHMGEMPFMDEEKRKALAFMRGNPGVALRLCAKRVVEFWTGSAAPIASLERAGSFERFVLLCNLCLPLAMLVGAVRLAVARIPLLVPLATLPVFFPLVYYVTHASLRYRHALDPAAFLLAAAAFVPARCFRSVVKSASGFAPQ